MENVVNLRVDAVERKVSIMCWEQDHGWAIDMMNHMGGTANLIISEGNTSVEKEAETLLVSDQLIMFKDNMRAGTIRLLLGRPIVQYYDAETLLDACLWLSKIWKEVEVTFGEDIWREKIRGMVEKNGGCYGPERRN